MQYPDGPLRAEEEDKRVSHEDGAEVEVRET